MDSRTVTLTTGYEVSLCEEEGLEHLYNAVFGESASRARESPDLKERGGLSLIYDLCTLELHYVAGQLHTIGSAIDLPMLIDEFESHWDRLADKLRNKDA